MDGVEIRISEDEIPKEGTKNNWYQAVSLEDAKSIIKANITSAVRSFIAIGYYLKHIRDNQMFLMDGYLTIWEFANEEYGISKSTASRYMAMNDRFSRDGNSPVVDSRYKDFGKSQLQEMLYLTDTQMNQVTPEMLVFDIRQIGKPEPEDNQQIPGQMEIAEFPNYLPEDMLGPIDYGYQESSRLEQEKKVFELSVVDMVGAGATNVQQTIAISQQEEIRQKIELAETVIEGEFVEVHEFGEVARKYLYMYTMQHIDEEICFLEQNLNLVKKDKEFRQERACQKLSMRYDGMILLKEKFKTEVASGKREQPELPPLKNNDQRAAFVDAYETWPLWIETEQTGERYYQYNLADETSMVVKVYHAKLFDYKAEPGMKYEERFKEGYGRHEYYLIQEGKLFRDCNTNRSTLIEKLKEIQREDSK